MRATEKMLSGIIWSSEFGPVWLFASSFSSGIRYFLGIPVFVLHSLIFVGIPDFFQESLMLLGIPDFLREAQKALFYKGF